MGRDSDRIIFIALVAIAIGLVLPAYPKVVAKCAERGIELSWLGHVGVFVLLAVVAVFAVVLFCIMLGLIGSFIEWLTDRGNPPSDNHS